LKYADSLGTVVAHPRDPFAANENSSAGDVIRDLIDSDFDDVFISADNPPWFVYLQPTSPLRTGQHILSAFEELVQYPNVDAIVSVSSTDESKPNGAIYIFSYQEFLKTGALPTVETLTVAMSAESSRELKTSSDLAELEKFFS
jgi:CMP-N-acetylneuraminic acid synthetase